jgi:hypothetical protein
MIKIIHVLILAIAGAFGVWLAGGNLNQMWLIASGVIVGYWNHHFVFGASK